jgi:hypothetical protein
MHAVWLSLDFLFIYVMLKIGRFDSYKDEKVRHLNHYKENQQIINYEFGGYKDGLVAGAEDPHSQHNTNNNNIGRFKKKKL